MLILQNDIPFEEIDSELVGAIRLLNYDYGIKTKYCCFGHGEKASLYIMFHEDMNDCIEDLAVKVAEHINAVDSSFKFWIRGVRGKVERNWLYETNGPKTDPERHRILNEFIDVLHNYYAKKGGH
jgi:hypothetical protein